MLNSSSRGKGQNIPNDTAQVQSTKTAICEILMFSHGKPVEDFYFCTLSSVRRTSYSVFAACAHLEVSNNSLVVSVKKRMV